MKFNFSRKGGIVDKKYKVGRHVFSIATQEQEYIIFHGGKERGSTAKPLVHYLPPLLIVLIAGSF